MRHRKRSQQRVAGRRIKEPVRLPIQHIEFHKVMRQAVIVDGMLGVHPFTVHDVAVSQHIPECVSVNARPLLEQIKMLLAIAAVKIVAAALQEQIALVIEGNGRIGAVNLLFDDKMLAGNALKRNPGKIFVPRLQA